MTDEGPVLYAWEIEEAEKKRRAALIRTKKVKRCSVCGLKLCHCQLGLQNWQPGGELAKR